MKNLLFILVFFLISGCGFQSIYNVDHASNQDREEFQNELASIKIKYERKRVNQQLRADLDDTLNPDKISVPPKYLLTVNLTKSISSTFTTDIGASGRNKVTLTAQYNLKDIESGDVVSVGSVLAQDDFDVEDKRYANYIAEQTIELNLIKIITRNLRNALIMDIAQKNKIKDE